MSHERQMLVLSGIWFVVFCVVILAATNEHKRQQVKIADLENKIKVYTATPESWGDFTKRQKGRCK